MLSHGVQSQVLLSWGGGWLHSQAKISRSQTCKFGAHKSPSPHSPTRQVASICRNQQKTPRGYREIKGECLILPTRGQYPQAQGTEGRIKFRTPMTAANHHPRPQVRPKWRCQGTSSHTHSHRGDVGQAETLMLQDVKRMQKPLLSLGCWVDSHLDQTKVP